MCSSKLVIGLEIFRLSPPLQNKSDHINILLLMLFYLNLHDALFLLKNAALCNSLFLVMIYFSSSDKNKKV